jgi:hypothetical protein
MKRIARSFPSTPDAGIVYVAVPDGVTPSFKALSNDERAHFWNAAINSLVLLLTTSKNGIGPPTVPLSGGHGTLFAESRVLLGYDPESAISPVKRAYVMLKLLGEGTTDDGEMDHWHAKEFRYAAAIWFDKFDVIADSMNVAHESLPGQRWTIMLAALLSIVHATAGFPVAQLGLFDLYDAAFSRCANGEEVTVVAPSSQVGSTITRLDSQILRDQWACANEALCNRGLAPAMLARLTMRVLCQRLFIVLPGNDLSRRRFFSQWIAWLEGAAPRGSAQLIACLKQLRQFGGSAPLDPGPDYPDIFRPYKGEDCLPLELFEDKIDVDERVHVVDAYRQALVVVDRVQDLLTAQPSPHTKGAGFDQFAYIYLRGRMNTTRTDWNRLAKAGDGVTSASPSLSDRLQMQRLVDELSRSDERTIRRVGKALKEAPAGMIPIATPADGSQRSAGMTGGAANLVQQGTLP